ncbi:MMPL family transporter [Tsukamurella asaccharolytica]|uniref:MMPL family transporter n=1 Tax=Tsukamurella asaccharolytica TaxID=2592067 RepID=A0A5C5R9P7_9ACTN|nr:MMPL family transporter [Tsukamurella asaccharolytica]TWS19538.1 MMPL family transporter [Tsukamurella asaccharolytica]
MTAWWDRYAKLVSGQRAWVIGVVLLLLGGAIIGFVGGNSSADESPNTLPNSAQSARIDAYLAQFPDAEVGTAILVVDRTDGARLTDTDTAAVTAARERMLAVDRSTAAEPAGPPLIVSPDGKAALVTVPVSAEISGFPLRDTVSSLRESARAGLPAPLSAHVTGGPAFAADIADSFSGANVTLLAVTALVVALLLIVTYRSPVLWLVPLVIIAVADRVAISVGTALSEATGLTFDGSTSGITSVLVFGAGTNYALLMISRYRDELRRREDHRAALRAAVRRAGPAILASNLTVVLALTTLLFAALPNTRSLGAAAAAGLLLAMVFALFVLPPALGIFGRKLFWPFIPRVDPSLDVEDADLHSTGPWHRIADAVVANPARSLFAAAALLVVCTLGLIGTSIGLSQTEQFRVAADSVTGFAVVDEHFPAGEADPTVVVARTSAAEAVQNTLRETPGVDRVIPSGTSPTGYSRWSVILTSAPATEAAFDTVAGMRERLGAISQADALVGGSDARALDTRDAAAADRALTIPLILVVVLLVLYALLRSAIAPILLVLATVASTVAAIGLGTFVGETVFGFPALDNNTVLFAFLFLVALGVDYTIFLVARAQEESARHPVPEAMKRAVSATGAVITSAGVVLAAVFAVLGVLPLITLTQLGIIVGLGILLDTFLVRTIVVPAMFTLVGERIWWPTPPSLHGTAQDTDSRP